MEKISADKLRNEIAERKHAEVELREINAYLENLLDYANAPIIVWNPEFRITKFNHAFERLTGYEEAEVVGKELEILFPEDSLERSMHEIKQTSAGEYWESVEIPILRKGGDVRIVLWNSANINGPDCEMLIATIAQGVDITERKHAEAELRETNAYLENLLDYANAPIIVWNPEFRITKFNHAFERLTGYEEAEVVGKELEILFPEDSLERSMHEIKQTSVGEYWESVEIPILRKGGDVRIVLWNSANINSPDGELIIATIAQGVDITERKHAEAALRDSTRKIEHLHRIAHQLEGCKSETEVYRMTIEATDAVLNFSFASLYIAEGGVLVEKAFSRDMVSNMSREISLDDENVVAKIYHSEVSSVLNNINDMPMVGQAQYNLQSGIIAPIKNIGLFCVCSTEKNAFSQEDVRLLELLLGHSDEAIKRIRLQEILKEQAIHDPLTGVYNRRYFNHVIEQEISRSSRYEHQIGLLMIDIDYFKQINDTHGHQVGDQVLHKIAAILVGQVRDTDIVVRYGGDEFLLVLIESDKETNIIKQRIIMAIAEQNRLNAIASFSVNISIGAVHWNPVSNISLEDALAEADRMMYAAKHEKQHIPRTLESE
jgi:diguanylate cyclase (GGDEF)-like protein/PAS domain S-box-containing protein